MTKKTVCSLALVAVLVLCVQSALAQNYLSTPAKQSIQQYGPFTNTKSGSVTRNAGKKGQCGNPAGACLFYGGDFLDNPVGPPSLPNGLSNEDTTFIFGVPYGGAVYTPFIVPAGQTWAVTGLFSNDQSQYGVLDQAPNVPTAAAYWEIQQGILPGFAGTILASGTAAATGTPTGRSAFGLFEYTVQVTGLSVNLSSGTYWLAVVPICSNTGNPYCEGRFFLSDVEYINGPPKNAVGTEPLDLSYFNSPFFFYNYGPTWGPLGAVFGDGGDAFSAGVLGTK